MANINLRNLNELEKFIKKNIPNQIIKEGKVELALKIAMREAVQKVVYDAYQPQVYSRRGDNGGLLDVDVMRITDAFVSGDAFNIIFQNVATGSDTLSGELLAPTIINGIEENWQRTGVWSQPRDFITDTVNRLLNSNVLKVAIEDAFRKCGFKVSR